MIEELYILRFNPDVFDWFRDTLYFKRMNKALGYANNVLYDTLEDIKEIFITNFNNVIYRINVRFDNNEVKHVADIIVENYSDEQSF